MQMTENAECIFFLQLIVFLEEKIQETWDIFRNSRRICTKALISSHMTMCHN